MFAYVATLSLLTSACYIPDEHNIKLVYTLEIDTNSPISKQYVTYLFHQISKQYKYVKFKAAITGAYRYLWTTYLMFEAIKSHESESAM